jgi:hypothetical protein
VRRDRIRKLRRNGVTALRVWCQWDFRALHLFADVGTGQSLFESNGDLDGCFADRLCLLAGLTADLGMVLEVTLFSQERRPNLAPRSLERGAENVSDLLLPYRNVLLQIWNESDERTERYYELIKGIDAERLVTSCPEFSDFLGSEGHNTMLDVLTPHTVRQPPVRFWVDAPRQVGQLLDTYGKLVLDDEPARCGLVKFGGILGGTSPA